MAHKVSDSHRIARNDTNYTDMTEQGDMTLVLTQTRWTTRCRGLAQDKTQPNTRLHASSSNIPALQRMSTARHSYLED